MRVVCSIRCGLLLQVSVCLSVCALDTLVSSVETDELIKMPFGEGSCGPQNYALDWSAHWRHLVNK